MSYIFSMMNSVTWNKEIGFSPSKSESLLSALICSLNAQIKNLMIKLRVYISNLSKEDSKRDRFPLNDYIMHVSN